MRKVERSPDRISAHNEKWKYRYHVRAQLRDRYPDEFKRLAETSSYHVALRLIEEAHPGEIPIELPRPAGKQGKGKLRCATCGDLLSLHTHTQAEACR